MSDAELLHQTMDDGRQVTVWQQDNLRWLEFGDGLIQTEIDLDRPDYLPESFNRAMLSGIMFNGEEPDSVLLAGTGGGSTARYFSHRFPDVKGDAVELSPTILTIAKQYFDCPHNNHWQCIGGDIRHYVQHSDKHYDLIVLDIAFEQASPAWLTEHNFLTACRQRLSPSGHIAINLIVEDEQGFLQRLSAIRHAFDKQTLCLSLPEHRNILVFAFNQMPLDSVLSESKLLTLQRQWQIEFSEFYQQMLKDNPKGSGII